MDKEILRKNITGYRPDLRSNLQRRHEVLFGDILDLVEKYPSGVPDDIEVSELNFTEAMKDDLTSYVPLVIDAYSWAESSLPGEFVFEDAKDLAVVAFDLIEEKCKDWGLPAELLSWAASFDWSDSRTVFDYFLTAPQYEETPKFLNLVVILMAKNKGNLAETFESIVNAQNPENGEHWHAARIMCAVKQMISYRDSFCDKLEHYLSLDIKHRDQSLSDFINESTELEIYEQAAFDAGWVYRDHWWRQNHGKAAREYYQRVDALDAQDKGRVVGANSTKEKATRMRDAVADLVTVAVQEKGMAFAFATSEIQATTIREIANSRFTGTFNFRKSELVSLSWFKERIEDMRASGELAAIAERALKKA